MTNPQFETVKVKTCLLFCFLSFLFYATPSYAGNSEKWIDTDGYVEFHFYTPHSEYDPNPGIDFQDRRVARYGLELYSEFRYTKFPRLFIFIHPFALFGNSRPHIEYNYKAEPIVIQLKYGAGFEIFKNFEIRTTHSEWKDLGGYESEKLMWNSISLRYEW